MADAPAPNAPPDPAVATARSQTELILVQLDAIRAHLRLVRGDMQTETNARGAQHVQGIQRTVAGLGQQIDSFEQQIDRFEQQTQRLECLEQQTRALEQLVEMQRPRLEMQVPGPEMHKLLQHLQGLLQELQGRGQEMRTQHAQIVADLRTLTENVRATHLALMSAAQFERMQTVRSVDTAATTGSRNVLVAKRALLQVPRAQRPDPWAPRTRGRPLRVRICVLARKPRSP